MKIVNMHEAKSTLSQLVRDVRKGTEAEIVIAVAGEPAAKIVSAERARKSLSVSR